MERLDVNHYFSARFVFDENKPFQLRAANTLWDWCLRIISWVYSPQCYSDENVKTIECFQRYLIDALGEERFNRISSRYDLDLVDKIYWGTPLYARDIAKVVVGAKNVTVVDLNEAIQRKRTQGVPEYAEVYTFQDLSAGMLEALKSEIQDPFQGHFVVPEITTRISGRATEIPGRFFYDPFLSDRERLQLVKEHPRLDFETFMHNMAARVIKRELDVGTLVQAPNHPGGGTQYYYVTGKVITGQGMVSYVLHPATNDTDLEPVRFFRGTAPRNSELDALSTIITDFERELGRSAYESGGIYDTVIEQNLPLPTIEAGHSLGGAIAQYRAVHLDHIKKLYLYSSPGIPEREVEQFNRKNPHMDLVIRITSTDPARKFGEVHLGYQAPSHVNVDLVKYYPPFEGYDGNPHVTVWNCGEPLYDIETVTIDERRDALLYHKNRTWEKIRSLVGPYFSRILGSFRNWFRSHFPSRIHEERGLRIGTIQSGVWSVEHYQEIPYTPQT